jgi:hypothetical protein
MSRDKKEMHESKSMLAVKQCIPSKKVRGFDFKLGYLSRRNVACVRLSLEQK